MSNPQASIVAPFTILLWIGSAIALGTLISVWIFSTHDAQGHPHTHLLRYEWQYAEEVQESFRKEMREDIKHIRARLEFTPDSQ